jgi:hypothetical protein
MSDYKSTAANQPEARDMSRIENDVEQLKRFADRADSITLRILRHARSLGYFEPQPGDAKVSAPMPVVTTMADAIQQLDRALDHCSGSLNVFD